MFGLLCRRSCGAALLAFALTGCGGPPTTTVEGTVRVKGKPFTECRVFVFDKDGNPHIGQVKVEGRYKVSAVPVGPVRIAVLPPARKGASPTGEEKQFANQPPKKFWSVATSGLTTELTDAPNTFDIDLP